MQEMSFWRRIQKRMTASFLKPVRVFCFHQVSDAFDPDTMWECDWTQTDVFKQKIMSLKSRFSFVSLTEANNHLAHDKIRFRKYAALTADDGWASINGILPWLFEQKIPITLFLNPLYMDGIHKQERATEKILTYAEINHIVSQFTPYVSIASHGWSHKDCLKMTEEEFITNVEKAREALKGMLGYIPYYAFTFGKHTAAQLQYLETTGIVPVLTNGEMNYHNGPINRECIDAGIETQIQR